MDILTLSVLTMENVFTWVLLARLNGSVSKAIVHWEKALEKMSEANESLEEAITEVRKGNEEMKEVKEQLSIIAQALRSMGGGV